MGEVQGRTGEDVVCCFVPTTPNPTSGFIIVVPKADTIELDMSVDEAAKLVMSLGVVVPTWNKQQTAELPLKDARRVALNGVLIKVISAASGVFLSLMARCAALYFAR